MKNKNKKEEWNQTLNMPKPLFNARNFLGLAATFIVPASFSTTTVPKLTTALFTKRRNNFIIII